MPVVKSLMDSLVKQHGKAEGERIYFSMESSAKGPFAPGAKHYDQHEAFAKKAGVAPIASKAKSKPAGPRARRARSPRTQS